MQMHVVIFIRIDMSTRFYCVPTPWRSPSVISDSCYFCRLGLLRPLSLPTRHPRLLSRLVLQLTAARGHGWAVGGQLEEQWLGNGWALGGCWGGQWSNGSRRGVLWLQALPHGPRRSPLNCFGVWSHLMKATGGQMCGIEWRRARRICGLSNNHASKQKV